MRLSLSGSLVGTLWSHQSFILAVCKLDSTIDYALLGFPFFAHPHKPHTDDQAVQVVDLAQKWINRNTKLLIKGDLPEHAQQRFVKVIPQWWPHLFGGPVARFVGATTGAARFGRATTGAARFAGTCGLTGTLSRASRSNSACSRRA